jgi:hypothetical protein
MQPGDYVIIARNATTFADYYPTAACNVVNMTIGLWNIGKPIYLNDSSSTIISSLNYTVYATAGMALKNNKTLELNAAGGWVESLVDGGTPCAENSVVGLLPLTVAADPTSVTENNATGVTFNVTSEGTAVDNATVTLLGCGVDVNDTTDVSGTVTISVTATSTGTIDVTATKDTYEDATTTVTVNSETATADDIIINEIMYDPDGDDIWYEWIELYNNDTESINVDGWILHGTIGGSNTILSGTMNAGSYLLIAKNVTAFQDRYPDVTCPVTKGNWSALANSGDTINLSDSTPTLIGTVTYTDIASVNYTAERNATGGWEESLVDGGTPCAENSVLSELLPLNVTAYPTSVINNTATDVTFNVTSDGSPVEGALVTLLGCGVDVNDTTDVSGTVTISVTATSTGTIGVTATKDGYDDATTTVDVTAATANPMDVAADPTSVIKDTTTDVTFNVTSEGTAVDNATVTLLGCGVDTNGTTDASGTVTISVTATSTGTIGVTATKDGYDDTTTTVDVIVYPTPSVTISLPTDVSAEHGNTVVVPLMANNVTNLANFDVNITYDPLVVNVTGVSVNDSFGGSSANALCNLKNAGQGSVNLVSFNLGDGYTGDRHLVDITLEAVGTAGQTSELGIVINGAANPDNDPIDPYPVASNGTFMVGGLLSLDVTADPTSVLKDTTTDVTFNVTRDGSPVEDALVTLLGCGVDVNDTTDVSGTVTISVTATSTGTIGVTATKDGYDDATTGVDVTAYPMTVTADPTSMLRGTTINVTFNVTSEGTAVEGALVELSGYGVDKNDTTDENGTVTISVTATSAGTIDVTVTKDTYEVATTTLAVTTPGGGGRGGGSGTYPPGWGEGAPAPAATSAPEEAASSAPTKAPTVAPTKAPTKAPTTAATEIATTKPTKGTPGFGAVLTVFAIAGLLVAAYLVMRRRE